jgi:hypothetical protein
MTTTAQAQAAYAELIDSAPPSGTPCKRNPEPFLDPEGTAYAKALCNRRCPIRDACRAFGDTYRLEGIYGGTDEKDRETARRSAGTRRARARRAAREAETQHTLDDALFGLAS